MIPRHSDNRWWLLALAAALVKAAIAGAGLGLAALAAMDVALALPLLNFWETYQIDTLVSTFALAGGVGGIIWRLFSTFALRI